VYRIKDKIVFYEIAIDDKAIEDTLVDVSKRFGELVPVEEVTDNEYLKGYLYQSDAEGTPLEEGIVVDEASISLEVMKDEIIKKQFEGAKVGSKLTFDLKKAYPNDTEISSLLKIDKEEAATLEGPFTFEIKEIQGFKSHEINQELFDKVYGDGQVNSEEEFRTKVREELTSNYRRESEYRFSIDAREYFLNRTKIELPLDFLKRWMIETNEKLTPEQVEKDITEYEEDFKWQIIKDQVIKENEIKTSEEEMFEFSKTLTRNQFYGYGLYNIPEDYLEQYSREQLAKPESSRKMYDQLMEQKAFRFIQETVSLDRKEVQWMSSDNYLKNNLLLK
jgi:trigger factor